MPICNRQIDGRVTRYWDWAVCHLGFKFSVAVVVCRVPGLLESNHRIWIDHNQARIARVNRLQHLRGGALAHGELSPRHNARFEGLAAMYRIMHSSIRHLE